MVEFDLQGHVHKMMFKAYTVLKLDFKLERKTAVKIVRLKGKRDRLDISVEENIIKV